MKKYLPVIILLCALLTGCGRQTQETKPVPADPVIDGTEVDPSQLETVPATQPTAPDTQPAAPTQQPTTQGTVSAETTAPTEATVPTQSTGDAPAESRPVPPEKEPDGYFNQVVKP